MTNFIILFLILLFNACIQPAYAAKDIMSLARNVDWTCMNLQVVGPCANFGPGVYLRYWEPVLVMETVKAPGSWQLLGSSNLHFHEVHLYDFPLKLFMSAALCPSVLNVTLGVRYLSEADSVRWRNPSGEQGLPQTQSAARTMAYHVGNWGALYPRTGFTIHASPAVSSALDALRAVSVAGDVMPTGHIVESPLDFQMNMLVDKIQMVDPAKSMCMAPGIDPRLWEPGRQSRDGNYVWVYWRYRECCKPIEVPP